MNIGIAKDKQGDSADALEAYMEARAVYEKNDYMLTPSGVRSESVLLCTLIASA